MLKLVILRHAMAVAEDGGSDRERRLTEAGKAEALAQGKWLMAQGLMPSRILCSPALRTRQTLENLGQAWGNLPEVELVAELYGFGDGSAYMAAISDKGGDAACLMVLGHNPSVHALALVLSGRTSEPEALEGLRGAYPTCAAAVLAFNLGRWDDIAAASGRLTAFHPPHSDSKSIT